MTAPSATLGRVEPSATHSAVPQPIGGVYGLGGSIESHPIPLPSLHDGEGPSFPGLVPSDDAVDSDSVMGIKPGDSGVVIGYQVVLVSILACLWYSYKCTAAYPAGSLFALSRQVRGHTCFCVPCWSILVYTSIFQVGPLLSRSPLLFWGCAGILCTCQYLYLLIS